MLCALWCDCGVGYSKCRMSKVFLNIAICVSVRVTSYYKIKFMLIALFQLSEWYLESRKRHQKYFFLFLLLCFGSLEIVIRKFTAIKLFTNNQKCYSTIMSVISRSTDENFSFSTTLCFSNVSEYSKMRN